MGLQSTGRVPHLRRLAGRVASRWNVRWAWLWTFLGFCLLAAVVVGGVTVDLPHPQVAAAVAKIPRSAEGPAGLPQQIIFDQPNDTAVGRQVTLTAWSATTTSPPERIDLTVLFRSDTPEVCTVSGSIVTPNAPGFCIITATQGGGGTYAPAPDVARAFRAHTGPEPQTITFDKPKDTAVGQPVTLTATASSGLTVLFRSDTPEVCTVSGSIVTPNARGFCTITASQGGSDHYAAARPVRSSFQAHTGTSPQTITFAQPQDVFLGQPVTLSASTDAAGRLPVSFRSDSPTVCTVSGSEVTTVRVGTCAVTAFQGGSATYAPAQASISFHVNDTGKRIPQQISFGPVPTATVGVPVVLTASSSRPVYETSSSPTGLAVSYSSRNQQVCTVSGATVVPWTAGLCVITASQDGNAQYQPAEPVTQKFAVERAAQTISFTPPASATIDQSVNLTATASSWLPVTYNSSTPNVCKVSGATVAATAAATCIITASQPGDGQYAPAHPVTGSIAVQKIPQRISFTPPASATIDKPVALTATASSGLPVTYSTITPDVCTVSGASVTATQGGTCTITASQPGDGKYLPATPVTQSFAVQKIPQTISFTPPKGAEARQRVALSASATSKLAVSFTSDTPGLCTISGSTLTPAKAGTCTVTASQAGDDRYAAAKPVSKSFPVQKIPQKISFTPPASATIDKPVTLTATASSGLPVTYTTTTPDVCTISGSATTTTIKAGTCTITASQAGDNRYIPATPMTESFAAQKIPQTISFTPPKGGEAGQRVVLSASATSKLAVTFISDTPGVCTVSGSRATAIKGGTCTIIASQAGDDRYAAAEPVRKSFPVARIPQTIDFPELGDVTFGRPVTLTAKASSGLPVTYTTTTSGVCSVSGSSATTVKVGTCAVTARQAGNDRYAPARDVQRSFAVHIGHAHGNASQDKKASQAITFGLLAPAAVGQVVHLSASATSGLAVSFRPDTPAVCSVSGATVTTTAAGTCTVTASQAGDNRYLTAHEITQSFQVHAGHQTQTITFPQPPKAKVGEPVTLSASATSGLVVAFQSDTPRICTVSGFTLTPATAGTCAVTASQGGSDRYATAPDVSHSFEVASAASTFPGLLTILLAAAVFAAAGVTTLVRRMRRSRRPPGPQPPSLRAAPDPGPPPLVSVKNTGAGATHTVHIDSSLGASITTIKEARP